MVATKSKSRKGKDTAQVEATDAVKQTASVATSERETKTMSEVASIVEFSEDIASQEAPVPLPVGDYPAEIRAAERKVSQRTQKAYAQVQFFVAPESYPADYTEGNPDGETLSYMRLSLEDNPRSRHRIRKFCEAIGAEVPGRKLDLNGWVGLTATITIGEEEFEGEKRAVIQKVGAA